jgi:alpha-2-macroglobulin
MSACMRKIFVLTTCTVVIFFTACNRSTVNLDFTNAKGEVQQLQNLVFRFDKGIVPDSILNQWDSTAYISFEPKIEGKFRWEHPDQLVFSPSRPLPPATSFKAKFHDDILQHSEFGRIGKAEDVSFHTPSLKLEQANVTWVLVDERSNNAAPQVDMYFNYPVKPESIKDKLLIEVQGKQIAFSVQTLSTDSRVSVRLAGLAPTDKDLDAKITLSKGLVPEGGRKRNRRRACLELCNSFSI